jgi:hypothetical protein
LPLRKQNNKHGAELENLNEAYMSLIMKPRFDLGPCQSTDSKVNVFFRPFDLTFHEAINETLSMEKMSSILRSILYNEW